MVTRQVLRRPVATGDTGGVFQPVSTDLGAVHEHGTLIHLHQKVYRGNEPDGAGPLLRRSASLPLPSEGAHSDTEPPLAAFWVVGRVLEGYDPVTKTTRNQEFYVCFKDGTSHSAIELAFELQHTKLS